MTNEPDIFVSLVNAIFERCPLIPRDAPAEILVNVLTDQFIPTDTLPQIRECFSNQIAEALQVLRREGNFRWIN
jgi:hypothetical protein